MALDGVLNTDNSAADAYARAQAAPVINSGVQPYSVVMVPGLTEQGPLQEALAHEAVYPRQTFNASVSVGSPSIRGSMRRVAAAVPQFTSFEEEMPAYPAFQSHMFQ